MHSIRWSCRTALPNSNFIFSIANGSQRAFSRSAMCRRGALPVFLEASSPELSQLLSTTNAKVLLPKHLTPEQRKLVFKPENRAKLESEPIEITLGDVTLPLEHINRTKDVPAHNLHLSKVVKTSKTPEDWENVLRMLEGYENARIHLQPPILSMVVRRLDRAGMHHLILKALQRPQATGLRLRDIRVVNTVMRGVRNRAWIAGWEKEDLKKALSMAEQIVELMDNEEHLGKITNPSQIDFRTHPAIVAVPLEMAAELAYRHDAETDKVRTYAQRLMNALQQHDFLSADIQRIEEASAKTEADFQRTYDQARFNASVYEELTTVIPIWNGLSSARTVLDKEMPMADDAERVQRQLRELLRKGEEALGRLRIRKGDELGVGGPDGYVGYVNRAIKACEDD